MAVLITRNAPDEGKVVRSNLNVNGSHQASFVYLGTAEMTRRADIKSYLSFDVCQSILMSEAI